MRILFLGDVVGISGCSKIMNNLLNLIEINKINFVVVNGENAADPGVGLTKEIYRCMNCGADLEQHINGKISYLPVMTSRSDGGVPFVKEWVE